MITPAEEAYIRTRAYVPEHIVSLMTLISEGDPFLIEDYLGLAKEDWLIFVGYPLDRDFSRERCQAVVQRAVGRFRPQYLWFIGPEIPACLMNASTERQTDQYYLFDIERTKPRPSLYRSAHAASKKLFVERGRAISREHEALISELLERGEMPSRVKELYRTMPDYLEHSSSAWALNVRDSLGRLCAFNVVELGVVHFSAYILGAHSKKVHAPHASDLLFLEMINLTREAGKPAINLGLGVNQGIRSFKEKWGGTPFLRYEFCECRYGLARRFPLIDAIMGKHSRP